MNINNKPGENLQIDALFFEARYVPNQTGRYHLNFDSCDWVCLLASPS